MARFNTVSDGIKTTNLAGGPAYELTAKEKLATIVLTSFLKDQFYRSKMSQFKEIRTLAGLVPHEFVAKLALYARNVFGMRTTSHMLAGEVALDKTPAEWKRRFFENVVYRTDDMMEILSYIKAVRGKLLPLPNALKRGFAGKLEKLDEYQLSKYRAEGKEVSLVDVVNLVHPKATDALGKLMRDELRATTYQARLTEIGQSDEITDKAAARREAWEKFVRNPKVEYFALLRNLRNIKQDAPELMAEALDVLTDAARIAASKVFPFRYLTLLEAGNWDAVDVRAMNKALEISVSNVPDMPGKTAILVDTSGSMMWSNGPIKLAALFAAVIAKRTEGDIYCFDTVATRFNYNPDDSVATTAARIRDKARGGGTNMVAGIRALDKHYDRIFVLSDMQSWMEAGVQAAYNAYVQEHGMSRVYSFDLCGYGTTQFANGAYLLAGFSEKVFEVVARMESGEIKSIVDEIEKVRL